MIYKIVQDEQDNLVNHVNILFILSMNFSRNQLVGGLLLLALIWAVILFRM